MKRPTPIPEDGPTLPQRPRARRAASNRPPAAPRVPPIERVRSGAPWEADVGYCRALAVGPHVWVSGTAPLAADGSTFAPGDAYRQMHRCLDIVEEALRSLGGALTDVVRTRIYVTDIARWREIGEAHAERLGGHPPAATMVEVRRLVRDEMLVELEVDAYVARRASA